MNPERTLPPDLITGSTQQLQWVIQLLQTLDNAEYAQPLVLLNGASVGGHIRHSLEAYQTLVAQYAKGRISYDSRKRNPQLETDRSTAIDHIRYLHVWLEGLSRPDVPLQLEADVLVHAGPAVPFTVGSTLGRELLYCHDHLLHHLALLRVALQVQWPLKELPEEMGIAPSTLRYRLQMENRNN